MNECPATSDLYSSLLDQVARLPQVAGTDDPAGSS